MSAYSIDLSPSEEEAEGCRKFRFRGSGLRSPPFVLKGGRLEERVFLRFQHGQPLCQPADQPFLPGASDPWSAS